MFHFQSLLSSEPTFTKLKFNDTFTALSTVCDNLDPNNKENRIHSLNIMRIMFRNSRLGEIVAPYIGRTVIVTIRSFTNEDWGVSNLHLIMLLPLHLHILFVNTLYGFYNISLSI